MAVGTLTPVGQLPIVYQGRTSTGQTIDLWTIGADGAITFNTAVSLDVVLSAVLSIAEGGTGSTSAADALVALGLTAVAAEINYLDIATLGTGAASKAVVLDASGDYAFPATASITMPSGGDFTFASGSTLDVAGTFEIANVAVSATAAEINLLDNQVASVSWAVAAGASNVCVLTGTLKDAAGATIAASRPIMLYISEASTGIGITADTYSTGASITVGTQLVALTANKAWLINTHTDGTFAISITDTAKPADQYAVAIDPQGQLSVSAASAALWGA